ncbi:HupE/UreJ family protein [Cobetia sp. cqz5-12]|uniref:HupE/UreJ family protein n=1 Tax=Cobetia sp. cqz5-12 TaxID=2609415 RepID=UPI0019057287|nr:HupE/UreJ family protein [Cobetia sp. cqz5-12]QQK64504.1 HupE/UreJ family protein [Cobetia sp. cqz5-12]
MTFTRFSAPRLTRAAISRLGLLLILFSGAAHAHVDTDSVGGFAAGFLHPLTGLDHFTAMVAVGLWGVILGRPATWLLPVVFPMIMALGSVVGIVGLALPGIEIGIALSALVLGAFIVWRVALPLWLACLVVSVFAICHGYAHGAELPLASDPFAFAMGFMLATGSLHAAGIGVGIMAERFRQGMLLRGLGILTALLGVYFLMEALA